VLTPSIEESPLSYEIGKNLSSKKFHGTLGIRHLSSPQELGGDPGMVRQEAWGWVLSLIVRTHPHTSCLANPGLPHYAQIPAASTESIRVHLSV